LRIQHKAFTAKVTKEIPLVRFPFCAGSVENIPQFLGHPEELTVPKDLARITRAHRISAARQMPRLLGMTPHEMGRVSKPTTFNFLDFA